MKHLWQQWQRNWRIAESRLLFLALLVSVTAVSSVTFFTDRSEQAMRQQAHQILGGDLVLQSTRPIAKNYLQYAHSLGLRSAQITTFPSMVLVNDKSQLVKIKAASANYPLFGQLQIANQLHGYSKEKPFSALSSLQAWAAPHLLIALGIDTGTSIQLGQSEITLSGVISKSPDQGAAAFEFMPQLLIPLNDLPKTGLLTPASRAKFKFVFAGDSQQIAALKAWLTPKLQAAEKIISLEDGLPSVQQALQRGQKFLALASLLSVILAGVAVALTSFSLSQRETNTVAVLKTLGASRKQMIWRYFSQLFSLATVAAIIGIVLGFFIQAVLALLLRDFINQSLPSPSLYPIISGVITAWVMVLGFSLPQLIHLVRLSPQQIFQQAQSHQPRLSKRILLPSLAISSGMLLLIYLQIHEIKLSISLLLGLLALVACFWLLAIVVLRGLYRLNTSLNKRFLRLPKANFRIGILLMVFGLGFFSLLLLTSLRTDLIDRWQDTLPDHAPNYFFINIQANEVDSVQQYFQQHQLDSHTPIYPMVRGRLTKINGTKIIAENYSNRRVKGMLNRELNISSASELPDGNSITEGDWFKSGATTGLSVEEGMAKSLKLKLGDVLTINIAGEQYQQKITSIRSVRWDSMQPNFLLLAAPKTLADKPHTFMTSLHIPPQEQSFIPTFIKHYPSVSAVDVSSIISKIKELIDKAAFAIQSIFIFTLFAGITVLIAALQSQKAERRKEIAILKSIGASHRYLRKIILTEFILIGSISGLIAASFAMLVSNLLAYQLFDLSPAINYSLLFIGIASGAILVGAGGYLNLRPLFKVAPRALF